jgi:cytosine/adenosine deaminase-related metal-dependent hydrolase
MRKKEITLICLLASALACGGSPTPPAPVDEAALDRATAGIGRSLDTLARKGTLTAEAADATRGRLSTGTDLDALAEADIAVIINPLIYGPGSFDQREARPDNAQLLAEAGVDVIISTRSAHFARSLRQLAGNAVRGGMDHTAAVRAITSTPARVFGLSDRGEIARGAFANLVIWSGDPLEIGTRVETMLIAGRAVELTSRQTDLFERYRELPGSPVPPLSLPGTEAVPPLR